MTASSESSHSAVSAGSMSGSCCEKPSKITGPMLAPALTLRNTLGSHAACAPALADGELATIAPTRTTVYTDGACIGNPGPGGWAWAVPGGRYASGAAARTTNQRMEICAALEAVRA